MVVLASPPQLAVRASPLPRSLALTGLSTSLRRAFTELLELLDRLLERVPVACDHLAVFAVLGELGEHLVHPLQHLALQGCHVIEELCSRSLAHVLHPRVSAPGGLGARPLTQYRAAPHPPGRSLTFITHQRW